MEAMSGEFGVVLPWELLYADGLAVMAEAEEELIKRLNEWKDNVESKGMRVNMNKAKVVMGGERRRVRLWDGCVGSAVGVLVAVHCSVVVARDGYMGVACRGWQSHFFAVAV